MNKNGEKTKLLAVIAVFAMVACALVALAPVADADAAANSYTDVDNGYTISAAGYDNLSFGQAFGDVSASYLGNARLCMGKVGIYARLRPRPGNGLYPERM